MRHRLGEIWEKPQSRGAGQTIENARFVQRPRGTGQLKKKQSVERFFESRQKLLVTLPHDKVQTFGIEFN